MDLIEIEDPRDANPRAEHALPRRTVERTLSEDPRWTLFVIEALPATRIFPVMETPLPIRAVERSESELPSIMASNDETLPPKRAKLRIDTALPRDTNPSAEKLEPKRPAERTLIVDPMVTKSLVESAPKRDLPVPARLIPLPERTKERQLIHEPSSIMPSALNLPPVRMNERTLSDEPRDTECTTETL